MLVKSQSDVVVFFLRSFHMPCLFSNYTCNCDRSEIKQLEKQKKK